MSQAAGDPDTDFETLYARHAPDVFRFALYLSRNRSDAEDITAETFVCAWTASEPMRVATVKTYLFTIARHLFLKSLRRTKREATLSEDLPDPAPGALERVLHQTELETVVARLGTLPELDRAALLMRALDGTPYQEIARVLGISEGSAKVKVHRARVALMKLRATARAGNEESR